VLLLLLVLVLVLVLDLWTLIRELGVSLL